MNIGKSVYNTPVKLEVTRTSVRILDAEDFLLCEFDCTSKKNALIAAEEIVSLINWRYT